MYFKSPRNRVLPGFGLTFGFSLTYTALIVLIPLSALFIRSSNIPWSGFVELISEPRALAAFKLTFLTSFLGAAIDAGLGFIIAWVLVRYRFPGRKLLDALIDLPFALPTAVSGIALTAIYSKNGWIGQYLEPLGIKVAYTSLGISVAMIFIGLPFVVRTLQPVIEQLDIETEEAAASLGANCFQTFFRVIFPSLIPSLLTGFALAFARSIGEYGSIVFISGNMPGKTEIASLLIVTKLEQYDYASATALSVVILLTSFTLLLAINSLQYFVGINQRRVA